MKTINNPISLNNLNFINEDSLKCQIKQFSSKCLEKLFSVKQEDIIFYINLLKPYILLHPLYWYTNPLVKIIKEHVGNELPTCFFNYIKEIEDDIDFQASISKAINQYHNIINNNEDITEEQVQELLVLTKIQKKISKETIINFIIYKIITQKLNINDSLYHELFFTYIEIFKQKSGENFYAFKKTIPDIIINDKKVTIHATAKEKFGNTLIYFNSKFLTCSMIQENLFVFFHEFWHTIQDRESITPLYLREKFDMDEYLKVTLGEYENNNYDNLSFENDANLNALILLYQYLNSINITCYNDTLEERIKYFKEKRDNNIRINKFGNEITLEDFYYQTIQSQTVKKRVLNPA